MMIILPALAIILPTQIGGADEMFHDMQSFLSNMPSTMQQQIAGLDGVQMWIVLAVVYMFAPFFLIIPLMVSAVIGADSFAGEKERKTLEALLYTPATDTELFLAKVLSALTPAIVVSWGRVHTLCARGQRGRLAGDGADILPDLELGRADPVGGAGRSRAGPEHNGAGLVESGLPSRRLTSWAAWWSCRSCFWYSARSEGCSTSVCQSWR